MGKIYKDFAEMMEQNRGIFKLLKEGEREGIYKAIWDSREGELDNLMTELDYLKATNGDFQKVRDESIQKNQENVKKVEDLEGIVRHLHKDEETSIFIIDGLKSHLSIKEDENSRMLNVIQKSKPYIQSLKENLSEKIAELKKYKHKMRKSQDGEVSLMAMVRKKDKKIEKLTKQIHSLEEDGLVAKNDNEAQKEILMNEHEKNIENMTERKDSIIDKMKAEFELVMQNFDREKLNTDKLEKELQKAKMFIESLRNEVEKVRSSTKQYQVLNHKMETELYRLNGDLKALQKTNSISWN